MAKVQACSFRLEQEHPSGPVCGLDEVGRGPLAGPVVAACVYVPPEFRDLPFWSAVNDSKKLSAPKRDALFEQIMTYSHFGIAECSVEEIDSINILQASLLAMTRALAKMVTDFGSTPALALVDGNRAPRNMPCQVQTVVKGDSISKSIAAASILAKVTRDRQMQMLCEQHPGYGWSSNAGYGTAQHLEGLRNLGLTIHHRRSFSPIGKMEALLKKA